jgi:hypothetical protein
VPPSGLSLSPGDQARTVSASKVNHALMPALDCCSGAMAGCHRKAHRPQAPSPCAPSRAHEPRFDSGALRQIRSRPNASSAAQPPPRGTLAPLRPPSRANTRTIRAGPSWHPTRRATARITACARGESYPPRDEAATEIPSLSTRKSSWGNASSTASQAALSRPA